MSVLDRFRLDGRVALVTGGSRGLGRGDGRGPGVGRGVGRGADRRKDAFRLAASVAAEIAGSTGGKAIGVAADVTSNADVTALVAKTLDTFGRLDILVNNAGINIRGPIETLSEDDWDRVVDTNLKGPWLCCRAAGEPMRRQKWGRVINVSSMLGEVSLPGRTPYCVASKGGWRC